MTREGLKLKDRGGAQVQLLKERGGAQVRTGGSPPLGLRFRRGEGFRFSC